ncbi:MAG: hypothetical protein A3H35_02720 [Betaproteobacteria bacterium RIFCSPLOWO2_02_FULL_62_17]|nr:MAG: hypothetical protein A3H35_02720 [Betaproteobacteria bacterium RIFCSPLOWO2_02_FULL_62_17]
MVGESHAMTILSGIDFLDCRDRNGNFASDATEARGALEPLVANFQMLGSEWANIQDYLAVTHVFHGYARVCIHRDGYIGREAIVHAPFINRAQQIWLGRGNF